IRKTILPCLLCRIGDDKKTFLHPSLAKGRGVPLLKSEQSRNVPGRHIARALKEREDLSLLRIKIAEELGMVCRPSLCLTSCLRLHSFERGRHALDEVGNPARDVRFGPSEVIIV